MASSLSQPKLKLESSDGQIFEVDRDIFKESIIKDFAENESNDIIPLSNINGNILKLVIQWATHHKDDEVRSESATTNFNDETSTCNMTSWNNEFLKVDEGTLFELVLAANYLRFEGLLDVTCKRIADLIKGRSPQSIRRIFNIKNDPTPEEEKQIQKEKEWCEEK